MNKRPTVVCVDLDGVILEELPDRKAGSFGDPIPGAKEALGFMNDQGWYVVIYTSRADVGLISHWLKTNGILFDEINRNSEIKLPNVGEAKPFADVYIDDRSVLFRGNWKRTYLEVLDFLSVRGEKPC